MNSAIEERVEQQEVVSNSDDEFWSRLNATYTSNERTGDFQADFYWPTKDRKLSETDVVVEIIGGKVYTEGDQPRLHFHLRLPALNKTAIKSCRLVPDSMRFLRMDMERLGIYIDDLRKLGAAVKELVNQPIQARLYFNEKTGWQDLDFMGLVPSNALPKTASLERRGPIDPDTVDWGGIA